MMFSEIYQKTATSKQLYLDPRTKILLCITVSTIIISGSGTGLMQYLQYVLSLLPLVFLIILKKYKMAIYYLFIYAIATIVPGLLLPYLPPILNLLFTGIIAFSTKLIPGMMMAYFLLTTTSVSEFVAAMDKMHITKKFTVPISVMFRFFPTIAEEYKNVRNAMILRGVETLRNPMKMLEYRMVPFLMSVVSIGNDLSASALTRALDAPTPRTNVCHIGFTWRDIVMFIFSFICAIFYVVALLQQGGIL